MKRFFVLILALWLAAVLAAGPLIGRAQEDGPALQEAMDAYLEGLVETGFSGAVLVAREGEILLHEGYGLADDAEGLAVTPDTVFLFGSITKQFTAAAVLDLETRDLLDTGDRIGAYLEGVPADKAGITLHQLLTHSTGLRHNLFSGDFEEITRDQAVSRILGSELLFEPGTGVSYSNAGYILLAAIVEIASGESWRGYLQDRLFRPAGMERTGYFNDARWRDQRVAHAYYSGRDLGSPEDWPGPYWSLIGSGGVMTTVGDMYRWYLALQDRTVLPAAAVEQLWTPYETIGGRASYGYGWVVVETEDRGRLLETTGAGRAHNAYFHSSPDDELVVIVASNHIDEPVLSRLLLTELDETLYAVQVGDALVGNILSGDFAALPEYAQPRARSLGLTTRGYGVAGAAGMLLVLGVWIAFRRRRN